MKGLRISPLEEVRFGPRTARVDAVTAGDVPAILTFCTDHGVRLLIARIPAGQEQAAQKLEDAGARLMDTLTYWEREYATRPPDPGMADPRVRSARDEDVAAIEAIAREAFRDYVSHYHADPRLDRARATDAYVDWAVQSCRDGEVADRVLVADMNGRVAGFATYRLGAERRYTLELGAVAGWARKQGLYGALAARGICDGHRIGARSFAISTQAANLTAQRVYSRLGAELVGAVNTFHLWF